MAQQKLSVVLLRILHGAFALYFISCIVVIYITVFTLQLNILFYISILSLVIEGILVFVLNGGDCPLIHIQKKFDDPVPFFNLFLPDKLAKKAVPFFSWITFLGIALLVMRIFLKV